MGRNPAEEKRALFRVDPGQRPFLIPPFISIILRKEKHITSCYNIFVIDIQKQVQHWRNGATEDWQVALELLNLGRTRHSLFFAHLALEKIFKAHVCQVTKNLAPRIHALLRLAELAELKLSQDQLKFLARFDRYQLEGRYPDMLPPAPDIETTQEEINQAMEILKWLNTQF